MKNWYCKPASKAEAIEIVERAVANGAVIYNVVVGMGGRRQYNWDQVGCWGCKDGKTYTCSDEDWFISEKLTIQQVREQFPFPHEVKKEWKGPQDGLPPVGTVCLVKNDEDAHEEYLKFCGKTVEIIAHTDGSVGCKLAVFKCVDNDGYYDFHGLVAECFAQLRTEREAWIEQALNVLQKDPCAMPSQLMGMVYDAIKSGALKAPDVD